MRELIKFKIDKGYTVYKMRAIDAIEIFNGFGICDNCNKFASKGIYVPILNRYLCEDCFIDWKERCKMYEDDLWFENAYVKFVDRFIKAHKEMKLIDNTKV